jgi:hypothetical protein
VRTLRLLAEVVAPDPDFFRTDGSREVLFRALTSAQKIVRAKVSEMPVFTEVGADRPPLKAPVVEALRRHPRNFLVDFLERLRRCSGNT